MATETGRFGPSGTNAGGVGMSQATYDADADSVVDNAELLQGQNSAYHLARANHTGTQALTTLADQAANTVLVEQTGSSAPPTALAMGASTFLARLAAGNIVAATTAQATALLDAATTSLQGLFKKATTATVDTGTADDEAITPSALNGSAPVLSIANTTGTRAGIDSDATTHAASNGSSHTFIDQDVTSGSSPTFTGSSITFSEVVVDVANDSIVLRDNTDGSTKRDTIADLATAMAGTNITASAGVLSATVGGATIGKAAITITGNSTATTLTDQNTWYQVTVFGTDNISRGNFTADSANDRITIASGFNDKVEIEWNVSFICSANSQVIEIGVSDDGGSTIKTPVLQRKAGTGTDVGSASMQTIVTVDASGGDKQITLWARNTTSAADTITIQEGYLESKEA